MKVVVYESVKCAISTYTHRMFMSIAPIKENFNFIADEVLYVVIWPDMAEVGGIQVLVKEFTDKLIDAGRSVSVVCEVGYYTKTLNANVSIFNLNGKNDISAIVEATRSAQPIEVRIIAFNATSGALAAKIVRATRGTAMRARILLGVYHPRTFLENRKLSALGFVSRVIAYGLGKRSIYFMNADSRAGHARAIGSSFLDSRIILLPVSERRKSWEARTTGNMRIVRIVSVGRITPFKAYNFAATKIATTLAMRNIQVAWDIYGWGEEEERLRNILECSSVVSFRGKIDSASFEGMLADYDLFIGMGMSAIRSAQAGIPTVLALEGHGESCLGYAFEAPHGNVGEVPDDLMGIQNVIDLVERHSSLPLDDVVAISKKCREWSEQFDYGNFVDEIDNAFEGSGFKSQCLYLFGSSLLLFSIAAKRALRNVVAKLGVRRVI